MTITASLPSWARFGSAIFSFIIFPLRVYAYAIIAPVTAGLIAITIGCTISINEIIAPSCCCFIIVVGFIAYTRFAIAYLATMTAFSAAGWPAVMIALTGIIIPRMVAIINSAALAIIAVEIRFARRTIGHLDICTDTSSFAAHFAIQGIGDYPLAVAVVVSAGIAIVTILIAGAYSP
jgi:hypothetical protein